MWAFDSLDAFGFCFTAMPAPGAVWPAIVRYGFDTYIELCSWMTPDTVNTQVRGPVAVTQARSDPGPESFRFVTLMTVPPRPPFDVAPPPCAPGNAGTTP